MPDKQPLEAIKKPDLLAPGISTNPLTGSKEFYTLPTSPITHLTNEIFNTLGSGREVDDMPDHNINRNNKIDVLTNGKRYAVTSENKKSSITIQLNNLDIIKGGNKGLKKIFAYVLIKSNEQNFRNNIGFSLQELVDNGMYSNLNNARRGVKDNIEKVMSILFKGEIKQGSKTIAEAGAVLITTYTIKNNYVTLFFNENINVEFVAKYYTIIPNYAFALPNKSFDLLYYIFYLARQNTRAIKEKGFFNISFRAIQNYLMLPNEKDTKKHSQYIINPIEEAIEEIEKANNNSDFTITPIFKNDYKNVNEFLDGYIQVGLKNAFADTFIKIAEDTAKKIEISEKRKEKAITLVEAKKLEKSINKQ